MEKVVTLGSCYVDFNVPHAPFGEGGIPVDVELVAGQYETVAGGSAVNFCRQLGALGVAETTFVGVTGNDDMADVLENLLKRSGIEALLDRRDALQTMISYNMTNEAGHHIMQVAGTANKHVDAAVLPTLEQALETANYLYLGGLCKLSNLLYDVDKLLGVVKASSTVVVDHGRIPNDMSEEDKAAVRKVVLASDVYLPSRQEFLTLWSVKTVEEGMRSVRAKNPHLFLAVKDGAGEVAYQYEDNSGSVRPPQITDVGELTGAGDVFNAGVISGLIGGKSLRESVELGCQVAARKITRQA